MAYVQHTHCVDTNDYTGTSKFLLALGGVFAALAVLLAFIGGGSVTGPLLYFGALLILLAVCEYLLGGKLICLEHDSCAIGRVMGLEPPGFNKPWPQNIDNDYSVNILLAPQLPGLTVAEAQANQVQGNLITKQPQVSAHPELTFTVYESEDVNKKNDKTPVLHCEFEGDRIYYVCSTAEAALGALVALGTALCWIPVIGWIICLIATLVALLAVGIAWAASAGGDPADSGLNDGELVVDRDYILVRGDWCYDSGHEGWNEFHPVKYVQRLNDPNDPTWKPPWVEVGASGTAADYDLFRKFRDEWCFETKKPEDPHTQVDQKDPKNRWCLHPVVDGCEDEDPVPPVPK